MLPTLGYLDPQGAAEVGASSSSPFGRRFGLPGPATARGSGASRLLGSRRRRSKDSLWSLVYNVRNKEVWSIVYGVELWSIYGID